MSPEFRKPHLSARGHEVVRMAVRWGRRPCGGRVQFSLAYLLLVTALVSLVAFAWSGLVRASQRNDPRGLVFFIALAIGLPVGAMIGTSLIRRAQHWWRDRR